MKRSIFITLFFTAVLFFSCSKDYNIQLPPEESKLTIECYLEDGQPLRALISESTHLLDTATVPPVFIQAMVVITNGTEKDTLRPFAYVDPVRRRVYNYGSTKIIRANYTAGTEYAIDVTDNKGRHAYGVTRFIKPVEISSLTPTFNNQNEAYCLTKFADEPMAKNYYRLLLTKNARYDSINLEQLIDDNLANNNNDIIYGSGYNFKRGDSVHATLYHLTYEYHQYLTTLQNAKSALLNPFAVSGEVVSNIKGGLGVFAALSFTKKSVLVQ